jgi:hypothetical protein
VGPGVEWGATAQHPRPGILERDHAERR